MTDTDYSGLTVDVRKTPDGESYDFGVQVGDAFVVFARRLAVAVDSEVALAKVEAEHAAAESAALPPPTPVTPTQ